MCIRTKEVTWSKLYASCRSYSNGVSRCCRIFRLTGNYDMRNATRQQEIRTDIYRLLRKASQSKIKIKVVLVSTPTTTVCPIEPFGSSNTDVQFATPRATVSFIDSCWLKLFEEFQCQREYSCDYLEHTFFRFTTSCSVSLDIRVV